MSKKNNIGMFSVARRDDYSGKAMIMRIGICICACVISYETNMYDYVNYVGYNNIYIKLY